MSTTDLPPHMVPSDHKGKKKKSKKPRPIVHDTEDGKTVTVDGITVTVPADAYDDFELLDLLHTLDTKRNGAQLPAILRRLVGEQEYATVMDKLRDEKTKRVPVKRASEFVLAVVKAARPS